MLNDCRKAKPMMEFDKTLFAARADELAARVAAEDGSSILSMMRPRVIACDPNEPSVAVSYPALSWELNAGGVVHGGVTGIMVDSAMGILAYAITGGMCPTVNLNISYPRPAPKDGVLTVKAKASMVGYSTLFLTAEMWDNRAPERIVATASGVFHNLHQPLYQQVDTAETLGE